MAIVVENKKMLTKSQVKTNLSKQEVQDIYNLPTADLERATTTDLRVIKNKLRAVEVRVKLLLYTKIKQKMDTNKLKEREQNKIQKATVRLAALNEQQLQEETTSKVGLCLL